MDKKLLVLQEYYERIQSYIDKLIPFAIGAFAILSVNNNADGEMEKLINHGEQFSWGFNLYAISVVMFILCKFFYFTASKVITNFLVNSVTPTLYRIKRWGQVGHIYFFLGNVFLLFSIFFIIYSFTTRISGVYFSVLILSALTLPFALGHLLIKLKS